ncbi:hypothetical protein HMY34_02645 [Thiothrix subterranea]|uniref:hypothetical protein n=1 Tax=Thiothrix subterranea TaxID=2735563 RepID=UPI00192C3234|nr:hypothetical protein [Thiothrix subterranea]QQZ27738.1 hypothetical protein HMY34_02645 [Thiothrix subterranea]
MRFYGFLLCLPLVGLPVWAESPAVDAEREALEKWFESDTSEPPPVVINEGKLDFLATAPAGEALHHHQNKVKITAESLQEGWAQLEQCHDNLDQAAAMQITFRDGYIRDMKITEQRNIGKAWVEGSSLQLSKVGANARVCLQARTRALRIQDDGTYVLLNGPYMRKFLDGYYPMQVSMQIEYPADLLKVAGVTPAVQTGFSVQQQRGSVGFDALFAGELRTSIQFEAL